MIVNRRAHLRLVTDTDDPALFEQPAVLTARERITLLIGWLVFAWRCLTFPFRVVAATWRFAVKIGLGLIHGAINTVFAAFGVCFVGFVVFGIGRVLLHPLFH